jgi:hypothetical protein
MSQATASRIPGSSWSSPGPQTRALKFFHEYVTNVDAHIPVSRFYAPDCTFHNQNNAVYRGSAEMSAWLKQLFGEYQKLSHDILNAWEINEKNGETWIFIQMTRHAWVKGSTGEKPDASIPLMWVGRVGETDREDAHDGQQHLEVWFYWDTNLLRPFMDENAVTFQSQNVLKA